MNRAFSSIRYVHWHHASHELDTHFCFPLQPTGPIFLADNRIQKVYSIHDVARLRQSTVIADRILGNPEDLDPDLLHLIIIASEEVE